MPNELSEVVIKPEDWQTELVNAFKNSGIQIGELTRNMWIDDKNHIHFYTSPKKDPSYEMTRRLYNIYKLAGSPKIKNSKDQPEVFFMFNNGISKLFGGYNAGMGDKENPRAYTVMNPLGKDIIYANTIDDVLAELAHPIQDSFGKNNGIINNLKDKFVYLDNRDEEKGKYGNPKAMEYETHSVIEPLIKSYIYDNIVPDFLKNK